MLTSHPVTQHRAPPMDTAKSNMCTINSFPRSLANHSSTRERQYHNTPSLLGIPTHLYMTEFGPPLRHRAKLFSGNRRVAVSSAAQTSCLIFPSIRIIRLPVGPGLRTRAPSSRSAIIPNFRCIWPRLWPVLRKLIPAQPR